MKLSSLKYKEGSRSGVTLVELLVVMLIATILAVSMLPFLQKFITRSQYVAEAIPVVGSIRVELGIHYFDKNSLPGTTSNAALTARSSVIDPVGTAFGAKGGGIQTFVPFMNNNTASECYARAMFGNASPGAHTGPGKVAETTLGPVEVGGQTVDLDARHFASPAQLDINYQELTGKKLRPNDLQYIVPYEKGTSYIYAIGVFGSGGLKGGTGYAVLEIVDPENSRKILATWELYKPDKDNDGSQLSFITGVNQNANTIANTVWVPNEDYLASNGMRAQLIADLAAEGWSVSETTN